MENDQHKDAPGREQHPFKYSYLNIANCGNMHTSVMGKDIALYLGNPQRHALNRKHCKKKKEETTELITTLTVAMTFFSAPVFLCLFIGS